MPNLCLVTGGAGFIGRRLCAELLAEGYAVRALDDLIEQVHGDAPASPPDGVEFIRGDVRDREVVAKALEGVDQVFHLAAEVGVGQSCTRSPAMWAATISGPRCCWRRLSTGR